MLIATVIPHPEDAGYLLPTLADTKAVDSRSGFDTSTARTTNFSVNQRLDAGGPSMWQIFQVDR